MKILALTLFALLVVSGITTAQNTYPDSGKAFVYGLDMQKQRNPLASTFGLNLGYTPYTSINITHEAWSGSHGILFNAYQNNGSAIGGLDVHGNTNYSNNAGNYGSGAGSIIFLANGGVLDFYITPSSIGRSG